jgi:thioredoxin-dependent peroxiredoxin
MLKQNDKVPEDIRVLNEKGEDTTLGHYLGQPLVVYFYPKNNTPGCTIEAKNFRDMGDSLKDLGVKVLGVSKDSFKSHQSFKRKLGLHFELLSDPEHKLQEGFGVWQEKRMMGKTYWGTVRSTFLVDKSGEIIKVWPRVKPKDHAQEVIKFIESH